MTLVYTWSLKPVTKGIIVETEAMNYMKHKCPVPTIHVNKKKVRYPRINLPDGV